VLPVHQLEAFPSEGGHRLQGVAYREEQNLDAALLQPIETLVTVSIFARIFTNIIYRAIYKAIVKPRFNKIR
jgi:hypothetical protein